MKGKLNVIAPYSHEILFAPSLHGFRKIWKQEGMWIKKGSRLSEGEREIETKHTKTGCVSFQEKKTTAAMNVFPVNLQLQA